MIKEIAKIFDILDRIVYNWIDDLIENGVIGLKKKGNLKKKA